MSHTALDVWLTLLPIAAVLALSPLHLVPALLVLTGDNSRAGATFAAAWTLGVAAVVAGGVVAGQVSDMQVPPVDDSVSAAVKAVLGVLLVIGAVRHWRRRRRSGPPPAWWETLSAASPRRAAVTGMALSVANPKVLLLAGAAGVVAGTAEAGAPTGFVVGFTAIASATVMVPLLARSLGGDPAARWLRALRDRARTHHAHGMAAIFAMLGTLLLVESVIAW